MDEFLQRDLVFDIIPLKDPDSGGEISFIPSELESKLFGETDADGHPLYVYAVIDAAKVRFLTDRLSQCDLPHVCLYENDDYAETAPWLVQLEVEAELTRQYFAYDPGQDNPWHMLALDAGIVLRSRFGIKDVQHHLRRYTLLADEAGIRQYFRFQEPGFLDAVLRCSNQVEVASFFARVESFMYMFPALNDGLWDAVKTSPQPGLNLSENATFNLPVIDKTKRAAMHDVLCTRQGRNLAIHGGTPASERKMRAEVYTRLFNAGFNNETALIGTYDLLAQIPAEAHASIWQAIESGDHSLGFLNYKIAKHYNLEVDVT
ncbi:DUF4123 domain-containing protein [Yoonia maritima]|uniref:DUF4123 domain-containing protein n=1 Tax=Yoonia maritima TaxID=1435347 RepID=UPI000D0E609B|nr:DUF4123 domain-containing protein [Yoonia maritima]